MLSSYSFVIYECLSQQIAPLEPFRVSEMTINNEFMTSPTFKKKVEPTETSTKGQIDNVLLICTENTASTYYLVSL